MNIETLILRRKSELDLTNGDIATKMTAAIGEKVSSESIGHYFTGTAGIPIEKIGPFLGALGLRVVRDDEVSISREKLKVLSALAIEALHLQDGDSRQRKR